MRAPTRSGTLALICSRQLSIGDQTRHLIEHRAYLKWLARGFRRDLAMQSWLEAEAEINAAIGQAKPHAS